MLLAFTLVLIVLILGIMANIYSFFWPFFENLANISDYNSAYYWAISSVERWLLVTRYKKPWFEWSWWFFWDISYGPASDTILEGLWRLNLPNNWILWQINSRTTRIPSSGNGNVENQLSAIDSNNYNSLWVNYTESFVLSYDDTENTSMYYTWTDESDIVWFNSTIVWDIRLPPKLFSWFDWDPDAYLCDLENNIFCNIDWNNLYNDIVVNRLLEWKYQNQGNFTIFPTQKVDSTRDPKVVISNYDNCIRKDLINSNYPSKISFNSSSEFSPLINWWEDIDSHNLVSDLPLSMDLSHITFPSMFANSDISDLKLKIWLADLLFTRNEKIYPFLEYYFQFGQPVSDRFYNIIWNGRVWEYNIQINVKKSTSDDTVIGEFNVIF